MQKPHSYGVDNQPFRLTILSWMALATFVTVLLVDSLKKGSFDPLSFLETYGPYAGLVTVIFGLIYQAYDKFIWKINRFDKVPTLSGTWIGIGHNHPGVEPLRLELMKIEQNWQQILITVEVYKGNNEDPTKVSSWLDETNNKVKVDRMGTEYSEIALITECNSGYADFIFTYEHFGRAEEQDRFKGAMFLKYQKRGEFHELDGTYMNDKRGKDFKKGLVGKILFRRVSSQLIETEEALQNVKDTNVLAHLHKEVIA
jgi:hypothetical protein